MRSKELEALERIKSNIIIETEIKVNREAGIVNPYYNDYLILKQALQRLESIDNANPSEALECLEYIENKLKDLEYVAKQNDNEYLLSKYIPGEKFNTIKQALLKAQELKSENNALLEENKDLYVELAFGEKQYKELIECNMQYKNVLEIIKKKADLSALEMANDVNEFNEMTFHKKPYTQEEFDLLKRYFK